MYKIAKRFSTGEIVGVASIQDMKTRMMEVARGTRQTLPGEPKTWVAINHPDIDKSSITVIEEPSDDRREK